MKIVKQTLFKVSLCLFLILFHLPKPYAQAEGFTAVSAEVDFSQKLRNWDGFGFNYVQTSQTFDYKEWPQDYGGFTFLSEKDKQTIINLVFGNDGLKVGLLKMFLDPLHQQAAGGPYDHKATTGSMMYFAKNGLALSRAGGRDLSIITTLYGPPAYITKQKMIRGRDFDTARRKELIDYLVSWADYLRKEEQLPLKYISLHNEGEDWSRWPVDGTLGETSAKGHDYNFFWSPQQVNDIMKALRPALDKAGLNTVGVTPGENTNWYRFSHWGFAKAIHDDAKAFNSMALITSHGFYVGDLNANHWYGPHSNVGTELIRTKNPKLHSWVTSTAWQVNRNVMDALFIKEIHGSIYEAKINGLIPWCGIQTASQWNKPDPNPGCAIRVFDDGTYEIQKGYYCYKQVSRAGQPGMGVAFTQGMDSEISLIGFSSNGTKNPDAFIIINQGKGAKKVVVRIRGNNSKSFYAFRTTGRQIYQPKTTAGNWNDDSENYKQIGSFSVSKGTISYEAPAGSVTTFYAQ